MLIAIVIAEKIFDTNIHNCMHASSPSLPAPVKKRGRKKDSAEVRALNAQIRIEEKKKKLQRRSKNWKSDEVEKRNLKELEDCHAL